MRKYIAAFLLLTVAACQSPEVTEQRAMKALVQAGYSNIQLTRPKWYQRTGCSEKDTYARYFNATGPTDVPSQGSVCMGDWKGSTIRLD